MMQTLNLIEILNPFKPSEHQRSTLEFCPGASIEDLYPQLVTGELAIGLNGKIIVREERAVTYLADGDYLVLCPIVEGGGGGGKSVLRIVALLALAYFSAGMATGLYGALGGTFVAAGAGSTIAMLTGGVMLTGGMLISALLPAPEPKKADKTSPTYGLDGAKNTAAEGVPTPICYGTHRMAGNLIDNYVVNDGATQWLYMLVNAGEGEVSALTDLQLNELDIDTFNLSAAQQRELAGNASIAPFKDVEWTVQLGTATQLPIPWFQTTVTPQNIGFRLIPGWKLMTTLGAVDQIRVDFSCPGGLFGASDDGSIHDSSVPIEIQYRVLGTTAWSPLVIAQGVTSYKETTTWNNVTGYDDNGIYYSYPYTPTGSEARVGNIYYVSQSDGDGHILQIQVGTVSSVASYSASIPSIQTTSRSAVRRSVMSVTLPNAHYEVQVHRVNAEQQLTNPSNMDTCYVTDLNDIVFAQIGYRNTATVALKVRLGDLLTGIPNVTYLNHGKKVRVWNAVTKLWDFRASSNPAWVSLDILSNKRYGGGAALSRFDLVAWKDWADYCDANSLQFNGVFDVASNVWDSVQSVMRCGHASIVRVGTRYSVAIERAENPVMMFSVANMIKGSFEEIWHSTTDRANEIEGTFFDKDNYNNYKPKTIKVYDTAALAAGQPQRTTTVNLMGVTNAQQAWTDLNIMMNMNRYIQRTVKFSASMEALGCTVGSVVIVQHDMPQWGVGGRLDAGSTVSLLVLDRPVTMVYGTTYKALVHHSTVQSYAGTVSAVVSTTDTSSIILNGFDGVSKPDRLQVNGQDVQVFGIFTSGAQFGVTVNLITGVSSGAAYTLWNVDVIETCNVVNIAASGVPVVGVIVQLASPIATAPAQFTNFMFGETTKVAKPFRVKAISGTHDYHRDLTCIEYNASVYNAVGAVPTANYSSLPMYVSQATINGVSERMVPHGLSYQSQVTVTFSSTQQTYQRSTVYLSRNGGAFVRVGSDVYSMMVVAAQGELLTFQVVAMDVLGKAAPQSSAPTISYTVLGKNTVPGIVQALTYAFTDTGIQFNFNSPAEQDWLTTQAAIDSTFATTIFDAKATTFSWPFQLVGTYPVYFRSIVQGRIASASVSAAVTVLSPSTPTITSSQVLGGVLTLQWTGSKTSQPIREYQVRLGALGGTFATATVIGTATRTQNSFTFVIPTEGTQIAYVQAQDMGGNFSPASSATIIVNITSGLTLLADSQVIRISKAGVITPATINLTSIFTGALVGSVANFTNSLGLAMGGTNNARTLSTAGLGANPSITVTASLTSPGGTVYTNTTTIIQVNEGSDAISMLLSNEAQSVPAANDGTVLSLTGAATTVTIYRGAAVDTTNWTITKVDANLTSSISGYVVTITAVSADAAYCDITMSRTGYASIVRRFSVSKSKQGAQGTNGTSGTNGVAGARGTISLFYAVPGSAWGDGFAATAISSAGYGVPQSRDVVTIYNSTAGYSETRSYDASVPAWIAVTQVIDGNLLVTGTVSGTKLIAGTVDATRIDSRGLSIKDAAGNIILASGNALPIAYAATGTVNSAIVVGGRNLATNSNNFASGSFNYQYASYVGGGLPDVAGGTTAVRIALSGTSYDLFRSITGLIPGQTYMVSVWVKLDTAQNFCLVLNNGSAWNTAGIVGHSVITGAGWQRAVAQITTSTGSINCHFGGNSEFNPTVTQLSGNVIVCNLKVEYGNAATQWSYAPEDVDAGIAIAATTATWNGVTNAPLDIGNMVRTPTFDNQTSIRTWGSGQIVSVASQSFTKCLSTTSRDTLESPSTSVREGETIYFAASMNASSATSPVNFGGAFQNAAGNWVSFYACVGLSPGAAGWQFLSGSIVVPVGSGAVKMFPWVQINGTSDVSGTVLITNMYIGRSAPGATVGATIGTNLSGQMTTANISTFIAAAAIGTAQIGTLTAGNLTVAALSNTINGSSTSGQRVEITTNRIRVYDSSNVLRVKLGDLS